MNKLLNKPLKVFTLYALVVLVCSIPVYYGIIDFIWRLQLDEHNKLVSQKSQRELQNLQLSDTELRNSIGVWNSMQPGTSLRQVEVNEVRPDSVYTVMRVNRYVSAREVYRFRGLSSYFTVHNRYYHLVIETNVEETHETIIAITVVTILFFVILFAGFILLNKKLSAAIWKPFYDTLAGVKSFDLNDAQQISFKKTDIAEFNELNNSLSRLIDNNTSAFKEQKEFTENASHELQTPLGVIQSKLDLLLQSSSLTGEQSHIIEQANQALQRVSRINKNLLLLAKLENQQYPDTETIDLSNLLNESIHVVSEHGQSRNIIVESKIEPGIYTVCNKILLEILLNNLLLNAMRHTPGHGKIIITLAVEMFSVKNSGDTALNNNNLFKRFSTVSSRTPGSGLGLAIVKQICIRYGWKIHYTFINDFHTFSVRFRE